MSLGISSDAEDEANLASIQAQATVNAAIASANGTRDSANIQASASQAVAALNAANNLAIEKEEVTSRTQVAEIAAASAQNQATTQANATIQAAQTSANATITAAGLDVSTREAVASTAAGAQISSAQIDAAARANAASVDAGSRSATAQIEASATNHSADQQYAGVQYHEEAETGRLQTKLNYADEHFQIALGLAEKGLTLVGDTAGLGTAGLMPLDSAPFVSVRPVFTPAQIVQQVNQATAQNDARTASQVRQAQGDLAGRGFSSNSPLLDALRVGYAGQNMRANVEASAAIRLQSAQANADQTTKGQTLALSRWQEQEGVAIDAEKNQITRQVGILSAVAQMVNIG